jgi:pimeloyl-ACP methyl ester carboxylesterase
MLSWTRSWSTWEQELMLDTAIVPLHAGAPVAFECDGMRLVGALHGPVGRAGKVGVILLNQGPIDRAGSHRLYIKLAARLTLMGLPVLRFDARGVGESEGQWVAEHISVPEAYGNIQRGAWVPDTVAAIEFIRKVAGVERVVLGGLCGGACTALFAGAEHPAVDRVLAIGAPFTFSAVTQQVSDLPDAVVEHHAGRYIRKLLRPSAWKRLLSFETDYRTLVAVFGTMLRRRLSAFTGEGVAPGDVNVNVPMVNAIRSALRRGKRLLFVYGENDYLWQEFQQQLPRFGGDRSHLPFDLVTIPGANHILTEERWQDELYGAVISWLNTTTTRAG